MGIEMIVFFCIAALTITSLIALLTKGRKDNFHRAARMFVLRPPQVGTTDPRKSGFWYTTNWYAGEKVNEAIMEGKERYAHQRRSYHVRSRQKHSGHGR